MTEVSDWFVEKTATRTLKALEANFFGVAFFQRREELTAAILDLARPGMKVGFGGSVTLRELELPRLLKEKGAIPLDHWQEGLTKEEVLELRKMQLTCDLFLTGTNAVTEKGEIVNIDGGGNRTNAMTFGPAKVIIVAGINKVVPDTNAAIDRIRRVAAPMNAKRLKMAVPCVEKGYCQDCRSEMRICRVTSILHRKPISTDVSVYLVNEKLGY
ncbi:MAG: hypothetical protein A4E57_02771 [Syntrophorhabdaceae bacterium PtaU1.Bin034]|jgi:hypothetical protein|nr:MAG: hypothetical protein A4E57_02771 [Syntrophorhabdaceae bacterium PtaU1.Bin034]